MPSEIFDEATVAEIRLMYICGDEWDDFGNGVGLCDSHEALRAQVEELATVLTDWLAIHDRSLFAGEFEDDEELTADRARVVLARKTGEQ